MYAVVNDRVIETAHGYFKAPLGTMALGIFVLGERPSTAQKAVQPGSKYRAALPRLAARATAMAGC